MAVPIVYKQKTAKLNLVPHGMIDILSSPSSSTVLQYFRNANSAIAKELDLHQAGKN